MVNCFQLIILNNKYTKTNIVLKRFFQFSFLIFEKIDECIDW